jgi:hypothetical protein
MKSSSERFQEVDRAKRAKTAKESFFPFSKLGVLCVLRASNLVSGSFHSNERAAPWVRLESKAPVGAPPLSVAAYGEGPRAVSHLAIGLSAVFGAKN